MSILNYFFMGFVFTFGIDLLMGVTKIKNHPKMKGHTWGWNERLACIIVWPLAFIVFSVAFLKQFFSK